MTEAENEAVYKTGCRGTSPLAESVAVYTTHQQETHPRGLIEALKRLL